MRALFLLVLASCVVEQTAEHGGTVYDCGAGVEYCYIDDADEAVSNLVDRECHASTLVGDRYWPGLTNAIGLGCNYQCFHQGGCNAHNGCLCPAGDWEAP